MAEGSLHDLIDIGHSHSAVEQVVSGKVYQRAMTAESSATDDAGRPDLNIHSGAIGASFERFKHIEGA